MKGKRTVCQARVTQGVSTGAKSYAHSQRLSRTKGTSVLLTKPTTCVASGAVFKGSETTAGSYRTIMSSHVCGHK